MRRLWRGLLPTMLAAVFALSALPAGQASAAEERCFPETGFCISGRIREFWEQNGGLPVFGFPIARQGEELIEGKPFQVQRFERNRLELHLENNRPYDVLLGRLGADRLAQQGRDWQTAFPKSGNQDGCRFFPETGQSVCGAILAAWRANGLEIDGRAGKTEAESLALFGLPLSGLVTETLSDGKQYQLQWFERARFELHPENQPPYNVLLGLLGNEIRDGGAVAQPPAADQCADVKDPVNGRIRPSKCVSAGTALSVDVFGFDPNEQIGFWITAPDGSRVGTTNTLNIGPTGGESNIPFRTDGLTPGIWYIVFQGVSSGRQSIIYFKILGGQAAPAPQPTGNVPASINAEVSPTSGPAGTVYRFLGRGFKPGENVGIYLTGPDRAVYGVPFQQQAEDDGTTGGRLTSDADFPRGIWAITFEGVESGHKAIAYFEVK